MPRGSCRRSGPNADFSFLTRATILFADDPLGTTASIRGVGSLTVAASGALAVYGGLRCVLIHVGGNQTRLDVPRRTHSRRRRQPLDRHGVDVANREDPRDFVVANFHSLEEQLVDCMRYVPFIERNQAVVSPKFVPILMDACSLIDSILRDCTGGGKRHTFKEYAVLHEEHLELEGTTSLLLVSPLQLLRPFRGWRGATPVWWDAYNKVKQDRIRNYAAATYSCTVSAMAGLHQLLARSWQFLGQLTLAGWFNETSEGFGELGASRAAGSGPPDLPVQTRLFVSAIRGDFVDWSTEPPTIANWDFTERVKSHIWEWEGW